MEKHDVFPLNNQVLKSQDVITIDKPILKTSSSLASVAKTIPAPNCALPRTRTIEALAAAVVTPKGPLPSTTKALTTWKPPPQPPGRPTSFADPALLQDLGFSLDNQFGKDARDSYHQLRLKLRRILFGDRGIASSNLRPIRLGTPQIKGNTQRLLTIAPGSQAQPGMSSEKDYDLQRRLNKMSWGEATSGGSTGSGGSGGGVSNTPRLKAGGGGGVGRALWQVTWFGIKLAMLSGVCIWTANEGLWGSYAEAKQFHVKVEDMIRKLPAMFEEENIVKNLPGGPSKVGIDLKANDKK